MAPNPPNVAYIGNLSKPEQMIAYNAVIALDFQTPWDRPQEIAYRDVAAVRTVQELGGPAGVVPKKVSVGFSPPNGRAERLGPGGRHARELTMHSVECEIAVYTDTLTESRINFQADVLGVLKKVPRDLRRTADKNPDVLIAELFRNGKTANDYRGERFFAINKACSPEGNVADTFDNLFTGVALTSINLAFVIQKMMSIRGPDGLYLGVRPDTLVIPQSLYHDAIVATQMANIVYSGTAAGGNLAPGQAPGTAAMAQNPLATLLKWVKKIVVLQELQDGQAVNDTTWYVMDTSSGPCSFLYVEGEPAEYTTLMDPRDPNVFFSDQYFWGWRKSEGVAYGLPQFVARCEK